MLKKRLKDLDKWLESNYKSENEYLLKLKKKEEKWRSKYTEELKEYIFIPTQDDLKKYVKKGGYIRYVNLKGELKWGGILLKKYKFNNINMMHICNSSSKTFNVSFEKNYIFYKKHTTQADKTRKLFLSYLDKF